MSEKKPKGRPPKWKEPCTRFSIYLPERICKIMDSQPGSRTDVIVRLVEGIKNKRGKS